MAEFEIPEHPEYNRSIRKFETTDPAHADLFNAVVQTLINNDEFFKRVVEKQKEDALDKTGDAKDTTVTFDSEDEEHPSGWTDIAPVTGGEKQSSLWQKVSLFTKNVRYLWKLCGTNDISGLADGTLTGAVSKLNTDLQFKNISGDVTILMPNVMESVTAYVENGIVVIRAVINANLQPFAANVFKIPEKYAPRMPTYGNVSTPADAEDSGRIVYAGIDHEGNAGIWQITPLKYGEPFTIQYPLKRN